MPEFSLAALVLFTLSTVDRSAVHVGFIERPLCLGIVWGACSGDMVVPVLLGLCCELFWLDLFPIGSYLPPMPAFPLLILLPLSSQFGWATPQELALPLFLLLPLAYVPPLLEIRLRRAAIEGQALLTEQAEGRLPLGGLPGRIIARAMARHMLYAIPLFWGTLAAAAFLFSLARPLLEAAGGSLNAVWPGILCLCALGAFLALRLPRAYLVFFMSAAALGASLLI